MRFMMILKADAETEAGTPPTQEGLEAMGRYNEEMVRAGVMLDGAGLKPSSHGARVRFEDGRARVLDGPFAETKELLAGFWVIQVKDLDEAVEWAKRCPSEYIPSPDGAPEIELRPYFELEDFEEGEGLDRHRNPGGDGRQEGGGSRLVSPDADPTAPGTRDPRRAVEAVWRIESARLIAALARRVRDVGLAEDLAQDALVAALEQWPETGVPANPAAWLMTVARRRGIDRLRHRSRAEGKHRDLGRAADDARPGAAELEARWLEDLDDSIGDDRLRLIFVCCHPVLSTDARVALTLRLLGGLATDEIARAFLVPKATLAQRLVRAKRTLAEARVPFEVPRGDELATRLASVLEVIYLVFNEGYAATAGEDWMRPALCEEALRLGRVLAELMPGEPEVHGLVALMELQASRMPARTGPGGEPVLLPDQDRSRWDRLLLRRGLTALGRAESLGVAFGPYTLQAAIAAHHARARTVQETDWVRILALYDALAQVTPSPVVDLNRAVAVAMAFGPAAGLEAADALRDEPALAGYHWLPSIRGDFLAKLGRVEEARAELERAAALTRNEGERKLLRERAAGLG